MRLFRPVVSIFRRRGRTVVVDVLLQVPVRGLVWRCSYRRGRLKGIDGRVDGRIDRFGFAGVEIFVGVGEFIAGFGYRCSDRRRSFVRLNRDFSRSTCRDCGVLVGGGRLKQLQRCYRS